MLVVLETHWDRKQLAICQAVRCGRVELIFAEPNDVDCPSDFDPVEFVETVAAGRYGRLDGVLSSSDYPGASVAAAIAKRLGLPGSRPESVIGASHKYYSRLAQRAVAPEAVPGFALLDPAERPVAAPLRFPFFLKPVKGAFSVLARRIGDPDELERFVASKEVREFTGEYMAIFNRLVAAYTEFEADGRFFIAEELLKGQLVTVEGFACDGEVDILGIVDSGLYAGSSSFARFDYPSRLAQPTKERMRDVARRVVRELGLERSLFNIEMTWQPEQERISILEVNPRICGQFADLYQKVDGTSGYDVALALALGERPRVVRGAGPFGAAASFPLRVFEPVRVLAAPGAEQIAAAEAELAGTLVWSECAAGDDLCDFAADEDGASHRYAIANLGAASREALDSRLAQVCARLGYVFEPLAEAGPQAE